MNDTKKKRQKTPRLMKDFGSLLVEFCYKVDFPNDTYTKASFLLVSHVMIADLIVQIIAVRRDKIKVAPN